MKDFFLNAASALTTYGVFIVIGFLFGLIPASRFVINPDYYWVSTLASFLVTVMVFTGVRVALSMLLSIFWKSENEPK